MFKTRFYADYLRFEIKNGINEINYKEFRSGLLE